MADPRFYDNAGPLTLTRIAEIAGGRAPTADGGHMVSDVGSLDTATVGQLAFCEGPKFKVALERTKATVVLVTEALAANVPSGSVAIVCAQPALGFAKVSTALYPEAGLIWPLGRPPVHAIAPSARLGEGCVLAPGVFLGDGAEIGAGSFIGPGAVIGRGVQIGRNARIGANVVISHALIGDRCIVLSGTCIGQDGFGFVGGAKSHFKIPQLGRVIIQDDVELGANCTVDRGALGDTVIGEGTKIDNMVHIGHNTHIGRLATIVAQVGIAGSCEIGDYVQLGGQVGVADHLTVGAGAIVAAKGGVTGSLDGGQVYGGFPARPIGQWRREMGSLALLVKNRRKRNERDGSKD